MLGRSGEAATGACSYAPDGFGAERPIRCRSGTSDEAAHKASNAIRPSRTMSGVASPNRVSALRLSASRRMASPDQEIASP